MKFEYVEDLDECQRLWQSFSPNENLGDLWFIRKIFAKHIREKPLFIVGIDKEPIGILPLNDDGNNALDFFGNGQWLERNRSFLKNRKDLPLFIEKLPNDDISLSNIDASENEFFKFEEHEPGYILDLKKYSMDLDTYFQSFKKKQRKNIRYDIKQFLQKYDVKFKLNDLNNFDKMCELNVKRFGKRDSSFGGKRFTAALKEISEELLKQNKLQMISLEVNGSVEAVDLGIVHNNIYTVLAGGANRELKNIGKTLRVEDIKNAIKSNIPKMDFLADDCNWKELWNLEKEMMYKYEKG